MRINQAEQRAVIKRELLSERSCQNSKGTALHMKTPFGTISMYVRNITKLCLEQHEKYVRNND